MRKKAAFSEAYKSSCMFLIAHRVACCNEKEGSIQ